jgi:integrase
MSIYWDTKRKRWTFEFDRNVQGQRVRATKLLPRGWSQAQADAFDRTEAARLYAIAAGVQDDDPLIETAVTLYLRDKTHLKSIKTVTEHLAAVYSAYHGKRMSQLADVATVIREHTGSERVGTLKPATVKQRIALIKAACRWAWKKHGLTKHDPTGRMVMPVVNNERQVYHGRAEMLRACRACRNWSAPIALRVAFYTGMRLGELFKVRVVGDVLVLDDTKNGKPRAVPAHPKIRHLLRHLPLTGPKITVQRAWQRARDIVGLQGTHFHDWRHSAASEMINAGVPLHTVGKVLGHLDAKSTDRYAHLETVIIEAAINKIGKRA